MHWFVEHGNIFILTDDIFTCLLDIDECSMFSPCEQECTNTDGSYQCSCTEGFILKSDNSTCEGKNYFNVN